MPLYEYQCDACGDRFERIRKFSDPPLDEACHLCGGHTTKLMSSPAFQFKGSGFYITDYPKSGRPDSSSEGKGESGKSESNAEGKADSKKAASSETKSDSPAKLAASTQSKPDKKSDKS